MKTLMALMAVFAFLSVLNQFAGDAAAANTAAVCTMVCVAAISVIRELKP
jgi:hypothetical protein